MKYLFIFIIIISLVIAENNNKEEYNSVDVLNNIKFNQIGRKTWICKESNEIFR